MARFAVNYQGVGVGRFINTTNQHTQQTIKTKLNGKRTLSIIKRGKQKLYIDALNRYYEKHWSKT